MIILEREKQKGNESFRIGDLEDSLRCYTRSLEADSSNYIVYANRAMAYLKLERFEKADDDCTKSLQLENTYVKSWSRRGLTRFKRGMYSEVIERFYHII